MGVAGGRGKRLAFYEWVVFWRHIFAHSSTRLLGHMRVRIKATAFHKPEKTGMDHMILLTQFRIMCLLPPIEKQVE